ncbi:MAG TPA: adenylosuccinate lyase [Candidatus Omnitrophota bacterium]|nr:adenylosuccinate lyase [Candidatus Omnitrophota bacterium]
MIERYTRPEIGAIWTEENKLRKWLDVEIAALEALAKYGYIPKNIPSRVKKKAAFNVSEIKKIEGVTKHDVIAFLTNVAKRVGPAGRYIHFGLTSSDVLDTALAVQVKEASDVILRGLRELLAAVKTKALAHKNTIMAGRTHGVHAEPTTFGLKLAVFYGEISRGTERFRLAAEEMAFGKISGAVGTFANVDPRVEAYICRKLGLKPEPVSTQIVQRDRHASYMTAMALLGSSLEKLATEIRHLQRTEVREVEELFEKGQKGSSAMPHKRNPITCERVAGLARLLRGYALAAMENVALWHERDITHSSVERVIFPDGTIIMDYVTGLMTDIMKGLVVYKENMLSNLERSKGMVFSQAFLLALIRKGMTREEGYRTMQNCAKKVWDEGMTFRESVESDVTVKQYLEKREIEEIFDYRYHTKFVNEIFKRVGLGGKS